MDKDFGSGISCTRLSLKLRKVRHLNAEKNMVSDVLHPRAAASYSATTRTVSSLCSFLVCAASCSAIFYVRKRRQEKLVGCLAEATKP